MWTLLKIDRTNYNGKSMYTLGIVEFYFSPWNMKYSAVALLLMHCNTIFRALVTSQKTWDNKLMLLTTCFCAQHVYLLYLYRLRRNSRMLRTKKAGNQRFDDCTPRTWWSTGHAYCYDLLADSMISLTHLLCNSFNIRSNHLLCSSRSCARGL